MTYTSLTTSSVAASAAFFLLIAASLPWFCFNLASPVKRVRMRIH